MTTYQTINPEEVGNNMLPLFKNSKLTNFVFFNVFAFWMHSKLLCFTFNVVRCPECQEKMLLLPYISYTRGLLRKGNVLM